MGKIKIGINGFGRIGRLVFRIAQDMEDFEVVGVNDPFVEPKYAKYLLTHDTMHGHFNGTCEANDNGLVVNGKNVKMFNCLNPEEIDWHSIFSPE